ncbi:putative LOC107392962-like protein [Nothobranchius furzeri]|uniref:LOC107392962-like protein n=1 Tax=Nothobranchius furzeri TaxID=105023 RepID=A0A9D3BCW6_NOTFU|nr:putative LOC107392962-like protein [Nothobranchius furzeri]
MNTSLNCDTNTVTVSWTPGRGIFTYNVNANAFNIVDQQTCSTNGSSCNVTSLTCGESYQVSVSGLGKTCSSPAQTWNRVNAAPCPPTQVRVDFSCSSNNITVSWMASKGSVSYMAVADNGKDQLWTCNTSSTACQVSNLPCGQDYKVYVVGIDDKCTGAKSNITKIQTAPCVPGNIQPNLDCLSGVLNVTWQSTGNFSQFYTSVVSSTGQVSTCTSNNQYCIVRNLQCEMTYSVTVMAQSKACNSSLSPINKVTAAPCPPSSFLPVVNCDTGDFFVNWNNGIPGVVYTVSAVNASGFKYNCSGTTSGCHLSSLECGTQYNLTITPARNGCVGRNSSTHVVSTVPCVPRLSAVEIDCLTDSAWLMFNESAGAEAYIITANNTKGMVQIFECNTTSDVTCDLPPLMCSQNLTFTLKARNQQCTSAPSNAISRETPPCPPVNVNEIVNCDKGTITISWSAVPGAVTYTATLEELTTGKSKCCTTSGTTCNITGLPCGEMFSLHVTAEGRTCNSSESDIIMTRTAPCVPDNLNAKMSCSNNVATMSWNRSNGGQLYTVTAVSGGGQVDVCSSPDNQCDLTNLQCGLNYTATVTAEDIQCKSKPSDSVTLKTVPCTPENTSSVMDCQANSLVVSWSKSSGADSYIATLQDSNGQSTTCQGTTEGRCNVTGVGCGLVYHVSVVSSDGYCQSPPTPILNTPSVPCIARQIQARMDCNTGKALVSWNPSDGALSYIVMATGPPGQNVNCKTNMTSCELQGLLCGSSYSVSVMSQGEKCSSVANMVGNLVTGPCPPEHITSQYSMTIGQVQWDVANGAKYYIVNGQTEQGLSVSCNTSDTYCALYNMMCGQIYNITATANNQVCKDVSSVEAATITTEPCPPNNVEASVNSQNYQGTISWEATLGAVSYEAQLRGRDGHSLNCTTNNTFCTVQGLHCGVVYYTNVIANGGTLPSSPSATVLLVSAPCKAENVAGILDCYNNSATVSWSLGSGASSYMVSASSADGYYTYCQTDGNQCTLTDLQCDQIYNVTLSTISTHFQIDTPTNVTFNTRPCKPRNVGVDLQCGTRIANLYWSKKDYVELYLTTATSSMGTTLKCNSTNSTCQFPNLNCGELYVFSVTAYSKMCFSENSSIVEIQTEPCQPTGLSAKGSCNNDTVVLNWSKAKGALIYEVTAFEDQGYVATFQTNSTTLETDLPCGHQFNFTVKAQDNRCESPQSKAAHYKTGPCIPENLDSYTNCEDNLGSVSWSVAAKAEWYLAVAMGQDGNTYECTTNATTCIWNNLHCGQNYTVNVVAFDYTCTSMPSNRTIIRMAPCIPNNLKSSFNCTTKVGSLTWNASKTAEFYIATAETISGYKVQLSTNNTKAYFSEFACGQQYFLSVQAADSVCTSRSSPPSTVMSEPCPPTGVSSLMNCISSIAMVSWVTSTGAQFYIATVTAADGSSNICASDSDQCAMPNVPCGQNHTVTVVASDNVCNSDPSGPNILQSVPCIPTNVKINISCSNNKAVVSWNPSKGALRYTVVAESTLGAIANCNTTKLWCTLTNLTCGQQYSVQVTAQDNICSSLPSPPVDFQSVPCIPNNVSVALDCITNSILVDWLFAEGALRYKVKAQSSTGQVSTCNANITSCELGSLQCGQTYNVTAVALNDQCSSPPSNMLQMETVPCPPKNVAVVLDCYSNTAQVNWQASRGAQSYIVQALGIEEGESSCSTNSLSCTLQDLKCGFTYNVSVIAVDSMCNVSQSDVQLLQAVPCVPNLVQAHAVCESGGVMVSWEPSKGALFYTTLAQSSGVNPSKCNSTDTTCQFNDLLCGLKYSIAVIAQDNMCSSIESSFVEINTVKCVPQKVKAEMVCRNNTGVVSWQGDPAVSSYNVQAFGPDGNKIQCNSSDISCKLPGMHCGQLYNLTVTALDGRCDNSNAYLTLESVACKPTNVKASLQCNTNSAAVTWEKASGALSYVAMGDSEDGSQHLECNNTMTYCRLNDMMCGHTYNVSVFSQDKSCSSVKSDIVRVRSAPCPPQNVSAKVRCADGAILVSWSPNPDAQYFHALVVSNTGARFYCNSTVNNCTVSISAPPPCGQNYSITVQSVRDSCESKPSAVATTGSAPCVPKNAKGSLDCLSNAAWVLWDQSVGATSYFALAQAADGHSFNCTSSSTTCEITDLKCGMLYTFYVTATNEFCSSNHSNTFELETGPCALQAISAFTDCNSEIIMVEWEQKLDMPLYLVTAQADDKSMISCNSSSNSCLLFNAQCGTQYTIVVSASSDKCSSLRSPPTKIKTAPCVPSDVTVVPLCDQNGAAVSWANSAVATSYYLTATGPNGDVVTCNSSTNNCTLPMLHCGQTYGLSITAKGDNCTSYPSHMPYKTTPCPPTNLAVDTDCYTNSAVLSWNKTDNAIEYFGLTQSGNQDPLYCDSSTTSCTFQPLQCGAIYNFTVKAFDGTCNTSYSLPFEMGAAPCPPSNVSIRMQRIKQMYWAMISWSLVNCSGVEYMAKIQGQIGNNPQTLMNVTSYWLRRPYFELPIPCSTAFNMTVFSRNSGGVSKPSSIYSGISAPCPPQGVKYSGNTQSAVLSWNASALATSYTVYSVLGGSRVKLCNTTGLSCMLTNLDLYTTEVKACNKVGESNPSQNITGPTSARRRRDLHATQEMYLQYDYSQEDEGITDLKRPEVVSVTISGRSLHVKWKMVENAEEYTLILEDEQANLPLRVRHVKGDFHKETGIQPGTNYCVRVAAKNNNYTVSQSNYSKPKCTNIEAL